MIKAKKDFIIQKMMDAYMILAVGDSADAHVGQSRPLGHSLYRIGSFVIVEHSHSGSHIDTVLPSVNAVSSHKGVVVSPFTYGHLASNSKRQQQ